MDKNCVPLNETPMLRGSFCALLTGFARLQLHTYKLKLAFSHCMCLEKEALDFAALYDCDTAVVRSRITLFSSRAHQSIRPLRLQEQTSLKNHTS